MTMNKFLSVNFSRSFLVVLVLVGLPVVTSFGNNSGEALPLTVKATVKTETGIASYYGEKYHGRQTANGEIFNMYELTAAHPKLKFGTKVKVTHLANQRAVTVRINDRGPFVKGRVIDLSQAAATELQMIRAGLAEVTVEIVE
jgi:rare lipoprotein A (peptidoglycan hydrolase)